MQLAPEELTSWILVLYGLPNLLGIILAWRFQQPLLLTGNVFVIIFIGSLEGSLDFNEIIGGAVLAGLGVVILAALGLTDRISAIVPAPVVLGLLAGAVLPFVINVFTLLGDEPVMVGAALIGYLFGLRVLGDRLPAILPAVAAGFSTAAFTGRFDNLPSPIPPPLPLLQTPEFSLASIATVTPVMIILLTLQANLPSMVFLRSQNYQPPERTVNMVTGVSSAIGSLFGPTGVSLSLPATSLAAGPSAGDQRYRHRTVYLSGGAVLLVAILAGTAADLPTMVPIELLLALAGLAVVDVLAHALRQIASGPLKVGPLFAFAVSLSQISMLGLGPFFWSIVIGTGVSLLVEHTGRPSVLSHRH
jgi:benzoate membrane transport protein